MNARDEQRGERELIRRLAQRLGPQPGPLGFGDDLAPVAEGVGLLWSTDLLTDGVDFISTTHPWRAVGRKALAVNLSDCAACAAVPVAALCAVALCDQLSMADAEELLAGLIECGRQYGCPLRGGDTNSWSAPTVIAVTVIARPAADAPPVGRSGARPGDRVYLTGPVGGSLLGRHLDPQPRLREALTINRALRPTAMIDISDGLVIDLWNICSASGCGAEIDARLLDPLIHDDARERSRQTGHDPLEHALYDGEDFELIVIVPADVPEQRCRELGLLPLGRMTDHPAIALISADGSRRELELRGWEHFT